MGSVKPAASVATASWHASVPLRPRSSLKPKPLINGIASVTKIVQRPVCATSGVGDAVSRSEVLIQEFEALSDDAGPESDELDIHLKDLGALGIKIDDAYKAYFNVEDLELPDGSTRSFSGLTEQEFQELGQFEPQVTNKLMAALSERDSSAWIKFQSSVQKLKLKRSQVQRQIEQLQAAAAAASAVEAYAVEEDVEEEGAADRAAARMASQGRTKPVQIVLITGFEAFNQQLYKKAAQKVRQQFPALQLTVFSDRDIATKQEEMEEALENADVFFASLMFDFDQVEWLKSRIAAVPVRLVFESALELMSETQVGSFQMMAPAGKKAGPPPAVKKLLGLFGSGREEDRLSGYLSFLKIGPKLLKFFPGKKAQDLKHWLTIYSYWNEGGQGNVVSMLLYICNAFFADTGLEPAAVTSTPPTGCLHPNYSGYLSDPAAYLRWYEKEGPLRGTNAPTVAVLLYRKHVITNQPYIPQMITQLEAEGIIPIPIFINGVEAHTVVRDQLTTTQEQEAFRTGAQPRGTTSCDAVLVDSIVSTIGFPLVGGPAGTMEGGRQADIAKQILSSKNVPYFVAAPLLIQDIASWSRDGIAGLQSVVLYSLPELDGAIDTVPLGGLMGNNIFLIPERLKRLSKRIMKWTNLRKKAVADRKVAVLVYGFPPGVGATGTAALLNVPASLEETIRSLRNEGYDLGDLPEDLDGLGEAIVTALKMQEDGRVVARGVQGITDAGAGTAEQWGVNATGAEISLPRLKEMLTFDEDWGPTEWGPIPFLPEADILVSRMQKQWGDLSQYRGIQSTGKGDLLVSGVQLGNVFIATQPLLGIEGDPMRLLFDRDLTPHPQYTAFYKWLEQDYEADAIVHYGMHGTVEWLPGQPLGNSGLSWSDVLMSNMPNIYIYAANNPSESVVAKRRGYGTIVSHNVPPYGRAGLYKQMAELRNLLTDYREDPEVNAELREPIVDCLTIAGLEKDCPYQEATSDSDPVVLDTDTCADISNDDFHAYADKLYRYLQEVENRLFSEGLHVFGQAPSTSQLEQYLNAYVDGGLTPEVVSLIASTPVADLDSVRQRLERAYSSDATSSSQPTITSTNPSPASPLSPPSDDQPDHKDVLGDAISVRRLLSENVQETGSLVKALNGEFVLPEAGGDLLRDGPSVLPTGRNIHALDPYRMPSAAAEMRGALAGAAIVESHRKANNGEYPETLAVNLWGLDAIKTKGESVGLALWLVGARPAKEGTGRIARFELIPLEELGRPRIDVLCNMSGIFRDSFQNVVELLDDMFQKAAAADEPEDMNYIKKHSDEMKSQKFENPSARLFSNPAGDYGSMVNERVGASNWTSSDELGDTWASRNSYSYGRGGERGTARPDVLNSLLKSTDRIVQQIDSVEYGLTDIQEYYANTGALKAAAESARDGASVGCSIVEAFSNDVKPKELEEVLRLEYRSKLLNPKWANAMAAQGSGGAYEVSQRMTAMLGWGATVKYQEDWTWQQAAETYVLDEAMAKTLRENNPEAFRNIVKRMLEASGRGMWNADSKMQTKLQEMYGDIDDELERVNK